MNPRVDMRGDLRLDGRVVDDQGQPVAGARVSLDAKVHTIADQDGWFGFTDLTAGLYRLSARKADLCVDFTLVTAREGRPAVCLTMLRGNPVCVHVVDGDRPIAAARVMIDDQLLAVTDEAGVAVVRGIGAGFQVLDIDADGYAPASLAMSLALEPDGTIAHTISLVRGAALGGVVLGPDGAPVPEVAVRLWRDGWGAEAKTDASGAWRFAVVAAGAYQIRALANNYAGIADVSVDFDATAPRNDVVVRMQRGARVSGRVVETTHSPVIRPLVVATKRDAQYPDELTVRGDDHGRYELTGLPPGTYDVFAHAGHLASRMIEVTLGAGETARIDLAVEPAAIAGVVMDSSGGPIRGVQVSCIAPVRGDVTDEHGHFDLGAVPPGDYEVLVRWPDPRTLDFPSAVRVSAGDADARLELRSRR